MDNSYDKDGVRHRRERPEQSDALVVVGFSWQDIIEYLSNQIGEAAPEVRKRSTAWIVRARRNGIWIEFYEDDEKLARRLEQQTDDGPQIHAGRLHWM